MNWLILLSGSESYVTFGPTDVLLHGRGFYDVPTTMSTTLQLFINRTEGNNGTVIQCVNSYSGRIISETTLIIGIILAFVIVIMYYDSLIMDR